MLCTQAGSANLVVVKVFLVRGEVRRRDVDDALAALAAQTASLASPPFSSPHVAPAARVHRTERAIFLLRQHVHTSLKERVGGAVALSPVEKLFTAFQLLHALQQCHSRGVLHGDITASNCLLSSWGWLLLSDFASAYKPASLPADNPSLFSFFYDTDASRACHVAPERFTDDAHAAASALAPSADVFSAGAVLAALFSPDGAPLFDLAALMTWRSGGRDPRGKALSAIAATPGLGPPAAALVESMTSRSPSERRSAAEYLSCYEGTLFRGYFREAREASCAALWAAEGDARSRVLEAALAPLSAAIVAEEGGDERGGEGVLLGGPLLGSLACSALAQAGRRSSKRRALAAILHLAAPMCSPGDRAARLLPHALSLASDRAAPLRAAAAHAAAELLAPRHGPQQRWRSGADATATLRDVLHYALPALARLPNDPEECVRAAAADALPRLAALASAALQRAAGGDVPPTHLLGEAPQASGAAPPETSACMSASTHAAYRASLHSVLRESLSDALVAQSGSGGASAAAACASLQSSSACGDAFLQGAGGAEALLPAALACLNERLWRARGAAYGCAPALAKALGPAAAAALASAAENGLTDAHPTVAAAAAAVLAQMLRAGAVAQPPQASAEPPNASPHPPPTSPLLRRAALSAALACAPLRCHPSCALRCAAADCVAAATEALGQLDSAALLAPQLAHLFGGVAQARRLLASGDVSAQRILASSPPPLCWAEYTRLGRDVPSAAAQQPPSQQHALAVHSCACARRSASQQAPTPETAPHAPVLYATSGAAPHRPQPVTFPPSPQGAAVASALAAAAATPLRVASASTAVVAPRPDPPPPRPAFAPPPSPQAPPGSAAQPWRPACVLVAHHCEHRRRVNALVPSPPDAAAPWVLSVSDDGAAKVWTAAGSSSSQGGGGGGGAGAGALCALRSCVTYGSQGGRLTAAAALGADCVATGSAAGSVHTWRLERARAPPARGASATSTSSSSSYVGAADVRRAPTPDDPSSPSAITALACAPGSSPLLVVASLRGGVCGWDPRAHTGAPSWRLPWKIASSGAPLCLLLDPQAVAWLAVGSGRGEVSLWDARFQLPLTRWTHPDGAPCRALAHAGPDACLWVACGDGGEVAALDAAAACVTAVMRLRMPEDASDEPAALRAAGSAAASGLDPAPDALHMRALLSAGCGSLVSGSDDGCLRQWEPAQRHGTSAACRLLAAPGSAAAAHDGPPVAAAWRGVPVLQQRLRCAQPAARRQGAGAHEDAVTALCALHAHQGDRLLYSADRSGIVKAWL